MYKSFVLMEKVSVSNLRSSLKKTLTQLKKGKSIVITSRGKSIGIISPMVDERERARSYLQSISTTAKVRDIMSPLSVEWEAET
jgi:antitoxin (DNA-binding transcriptional repressor) of toxin-antitoxin stability system